MHQRSAKAAVFLFHPATLSEPQGLIQPTRDVMHI